MGGKKTVGTQPTRGNFLNYGRTVPRATPEGERPALAPFFAQDFSLFSQLEYVNGTGPVSGSPTAPGLAPEAAANAEYWRDSVREPPRKLPTAPVASVEQLQINDLQSQVEKLELSLKDIEVSATAGGATVGAGGSGQGKPVDLRRIYELMRTIEGRQRAIQSKLSYFDNLFGHTSENWLEAVDKVLYIFQYFDFYRYHGYPPAVTPSAPVAPAAPPGMMAMPFAYPAQMAPPQAQMPTTVYASAPQAAPRMHAPMHSGAYSPVASPSAAIDMSGYYAAPIAGYHQYPQAPPPQPRGPPQSFAHPYSSGGNHYYQHQQPYVRYDDPSGAGRNKVKKQQPLPPQQSPRAPGVSNGSDNSPKLNDAKVTAQVVDTAAAPASNQPPGSPASTEDPSPRSSEGASSISAPEAITESSDSSSKVGSPESADGSAK